MFDKVLTSLGAKILQCYDTGDCPSERAPHCKETFDAAVFTENNIRGNPRNMRQKMAD